MHARPLDTSTAPLSQPGKKPLWNTYFAKYLYEMKYESIEAHLQSNQEETDTKMVLHALDAISNGANELRIHSLVTGVLVLSIRRCLELCGKASFVNDKDVIKVTSLSASLKH